LARLLASLLLLLLWAVARLALLRRSGTHRAATAGSLWSADEARSAHASTGVLWAADHAHAARSFGHHPLGMARIAAGHAGVANWTATSSTRSRCLWWQACLWSAHAGRGSR
jgi:hypothetical protein